MYDVVLQCTDMRYQQVMIPVTPIHFSYLVNVTSIVWLNDSEFEMRAPSGGPVQAYIVKLYTAYQYAFRYVH